MSRSAPESDRHAWLTVAPFAHRGLHGAHVPENSREAFDAAVAAGYGVELDARLSRDGFAVVFHDADLDRLTGTPGKVAAMTAAALGRLSLGGTSERIETLAAILPGLRQARVLIELKTDDDPHVAARLCLSVRHALEGHRGQAAIMSFDPAVPRWFAEHAPHVPRGVVISEERRGPRETLRRHLSLRSASPHFVAYDVRALPSRLAARARRRVPLLAWTARTPAEHATAFRNADQVIFERP